MEKQRLVVSKFVSSERGFTLIEMLVVLAIFMVISSSLLYVTTEKLTNYTNEQIIDQTEVLIRLAQVKSIESKSRYEIQVINCQMIRVKHYADQGEILFEQTLPKGMRIFISTSNYRISFRPNGNGNSAGSMSYHLNGKYYSYSLNIGKGRLIPKNVGEIPEGTNTCRYAASTRHPIFSNVDTHPVDG